MWARDSGWTSTCLNDSPRDSWMHLLPPPNFCSSSGASAVAAVAADAFAGLSVGGIMIMKLVSVCVGGSRWLGVYSG
jgi:hypothetical protein